LKSSKSSSTAGTNPTLLDVDVDKLDTLWSDMATVAATFIDAGTPDDSGGGYVERCAEILELSSVIADFAAPCW